MPTLIFGVIPDLGIVVPGDIVLRTFANRSEVSTTIRLVEDQNIVLEPAFQNVSTFPPLTRVTVGDEFDIILNAAFTNTSTFGPDTEISEAPPDAVILMAAAFANASTFGAATEIDVAPADGIIILDVFTNSSTFGAATFMVVAEEAGDEDYDAIAEGFASETIPG